jgi:hypothetical protein
MPERPSEREAGEPKGPRDRDEAKIVPSDLTNKKFVQDLYANIKSDLILITEDKARHCLRDSIDFMARRNEWQTPAGILATLATVMLTTSPREALGVPAPTWRAVGIISTALCAFWLVKSLIKLGRSPRPSIDSIILQIKKFSVKE